MFGSYAIPTAPVMALRLLKILCGCAKHCGLLILLGLRIQAALEMTSHQWKLFLTVVHHA